MSEIEIVSSQPGSRVELLKGHFKKHEHLIKYFFIGASASAIDLMIFLFLFNLVDTTALLAHSISVPTSVVYSFLLNARHNFRTNDFWMLRMVLFCIVCTIGFAVGYLVIETVVLAGLGANIGKIFSLPAVFVTQFFLNSRLTFRKMSNRRT